MDFSRTTKNEFKQEDFSLKLLKWGIWLYFFLLIFEGALRKWILPSLAGPLVIVRDPVALIILLLGYKKGYLKLNVFMFVITCATIISISATLVLGHGNIAICMYGARIMLLHFPLIFIIGNFFNEDDVLKIGKVLLYISAPMTVLMALQFYSPQSAWVNRGIGGDVEGGGFSGGALGFFRPGGTFSFISGLTSFYGVLICFVLYFWYKPGIVSRFILILSTVCSVAAIPFSISRTLFFSTVLSLVFFLIGVSLNPKNISKVVFGTIGTVLILTLLSNFSIFKTPLEAFMVRFEGANEFEGGVEGVLLDRYLGSMFGSISGDTSSSFFGKGLGIATNFGSQLMVEQGGANNWVEDEWFRVIYESGFLLGLIVIGVRVFLALYLGFLSFKELIFGYPLPWLILSFCLVILPNGQWQQPTGLGFGVFVTGILLASLNRLDKVKV
ncbi:hypothetical protein EV196_103107 [Mariniflexile fucanivorans]|uniref:O-antigen ligase-like membrane protein n=1 Tax=Mariniflexile fucanivorans TaxID=264023 RepID=A0A4R1RKI1_9FLAO|nr:hypothetical protein [Mariniflexile fucanivorans]TCL66694.1 hypothetical protein EV196_103107 [Mariniflexile fucanivorans]